MKVSACLVTRGDVEMQDVIDSLPSSWEIVIWDNGARMVTRSDGWAEVCGDLAVYGRYAAIQCASHNLIYVQDDDVIVSDPQALVSQLANEFYTYQGVVCNIPQGFRPHYPDSGLVGFGAAFHRDAPRRAFDRFYYRDRPEQGDIRDSCEPGEFLRRADNVFTTLTPRVIIDIPKTDREMASDPSRMWRQEGHMDERDKMIELARRVRDSV